MTLGFFALTRLEFDLNIVAAVLTIVGYSINDKIVIDDRIRENMRKYRQMDMRAIVDLSVNETLPRTVMTSLTVLLALASLLLFGGHVLRGFTAAMILGVDRRHLFVDLRLLVAADHARPQAAAARRAEGQGRARRRRADHARGLLRPWRGSATTRPRARRPGRRRLRRGRRLPVDGRGLSTACS